MSGPATTPDPGHIHNWRRLDERLTTSGQPTEAELAEVAALGVRRVINLALPTSPRALPDEAATVQALGMEYVNIPVDFARPTEADYAAFVAAMDGAAGRRVHVHCAANYRVSAFLFRYRRNAPEVGPERARRELEGVWTPDDTWKAFIGLA